MKFELSFNDEYDCIIIRVNAFFIMVALCNRADHYIFMLWFVLSFFFFFFLA